jgi:hypothetical protein
MLKNVLGNSNATKTTVALFNSCRKVEKDEKGYFLTTAVKPFLNGVIVEKQYL